MDSKTVPKRVTILGSTGSIGVSALDVVRMEPQKFDVVGLAAHSNIDVLREQIREFEPEFVAVTDGAACEKLAEAKLGVSLLAGPEGVEELAGMDTDVVLCAVVGAAGLQPVLAAIAGGNRVALANKEPMVMAGPLIMDSARERHVDVLPVDSEHNAIFQCLQGHARESVECVYLTASGGPFYGRARSALREVTPAEAIQHPTWDMGAKISVDSATLMNKGLEVMEAMSLFDLPLEKVKVIIHPQSVVHGLVEFTDGSMLAHLGVTDMKFPIQFALMWPDRAQTPIKRLDLASLGSLSFAAPDFSEFPCLRLAFAAAKTGGTAPAILNAANEAAVSAFRKGEIGFLQISEVVEEVVAVCKVDYTMTLKTVLAADARGRVAAAEIIAASGVHCA